MERRSEWEKRAICLGKNTNWFFPDNGHDAYKKTCTSCPVISQCKSYAIAHDEVGIWGGTSSTERRNMPSALKLAIRGLYFEAGLLEFRPGLVESYIKYRVQLQLEQNVPTDGLVPDLDPTQDLVS